MRNNLVTTLKYKSRNTYIISKLYILSNITDYISKKRTSSWRKIKCDHKKTD